ncbi:MAG: winged helix-turn-helix domain-containing protein [Acidobacteria bacterium]|nr:winged helix-turn-helix domain-containing protein [Acidobacteriota bacterium]
MAIAEENITEGKLVHFEGFTLNVRKHGLFRGKDRIRLTAKPLETLIFLVEKHGQVAEKREILDAVWKDTFVTEDVLVQAVKELRRVLGDDKAAPRFIQTVPRQGYRFIADTSVELPFTTADSGDRASLSLVPVRAEQKWLVSPRLLVTALLVIAVVVGLFWFFRPIGSDPNPQLPTTVATHSISHLQTGEFPVGKPAFSPDGKLILYVGSSRETSGYGDLFVMPASGGDSLQITKRVSPSGDLPVFTADGSHIVFSRPRGGEGESRLLDLYIVPSSGGEMRLYLPEASGAGYSHDGNFVAYTKHLPSHKALRVSSTDNLAEYKEVATGAFTPRWSPDGRWLSFTTSDPNGGVGDIWVVETSTLTGASNLTNDPQQIYGLTWTPNSQSIIFSSKRTGPDLLWMISANGGPLRQIITNVGESSAPSIGPDADLLIFQNVRVLSDLRLSGLDQTSEARLITHGEFHRWPKLSPSAKKAVSVTRYPDFGDHLYLTDLESGVSARLGDGTASYPCWADEDNVAYIARPSDGKTTHIYVLNIGSGVKTPLTQFSEPAAWLAMHPSKRKLAVVLTGSDLRQRIVVRHLDSNHDETVVEGGEYSSLQWLPDGSALLWSGPAQASAPSSDGIWICEMAPKQVHRLAPDGYAPVWGTRSKSIYFSRGRKKSGLWRLDPVSGESHKIRTWPEFTAFDLSGSRLLFASGESRGQIYFVRFDQ